MNEDIINVEEENIEDTVPVEEETVIVNQGGTNDHSRLRKLDYESSGHTGFASSSDLSNEETARQNAVSNLQGQIDAITVSSDVVDIVGTYQDLQNYDTTKLTDDDIIKVMQDSTHSNAMSYYRWSSNTWVYVGSEGPFYTKSESDTKYQEKLVSGTNIKTINNNSILGGGNLDIESGYPEVPEAAYTLYNLIEIFSDETTIPDGIYTVTQDWFIDVPKQDDYMSDNILANSLLYINRYNNIIGWSGPSSSTYWYNGDGTFFGGVLNTTDDVDYAIDERLGSNVVMADTEQEISGKKTFTSHNGTVFQNAGGLILKYLSSSPEFKIIPDNNGNIDFYYQNTQLGRIYTNNTVLYSNVRPNLNETVNLGTSNYNWNKIYSKILASGSIEKNVVNLLTNDADIVPTYGNSFSIGSSSRLWNTLFALALHNGTTRIAISDIATKTELAGKQDTLTFDSTPTASSTNPVTSGGVFNSIQNVTEVAEGKTATYTLSYATTGNSGFNSNDANITVSSFVDRAGNTITYEDVKVGDIVLVIETDVPDRWVQSIDTINHTITFYKMETSKIDLTNYVDLDTAQTITGKKSFNGNIDVSSEINFSNNAYAGTIKWGKTTMLSLNSYVGIIFFATPRPSTDGGRNLGASNYRWNNLYLAGDLSDGTNSIAVNKIANKDNFVTLSQSDYDALTTKDPDTFYFIEEE